MSKAQQALRLVHFPLLQYMNKCHLNTPLPSSTSESQYIIVILANVWSERMSWLAYN